VGVEQLGGGLWQGLGGKEGYKKGKSLVGERGVVELNEGEKALTPRG